MPADKHDWAGGIQACVNSFRNGQLSAEEVACELLARIDRDDVRLNAMTYVDADAVLLQARQLDRLRSERRILGRLASVPIVAKDLIDVKGLPTSYNSPTFDPVVATRDATCVARMREAGALVVGKARSSEFAWSPDTSPTVNPVDPTLTVSGSSGGSAAAVGAGFAHVGLGTDTGGSIRCPAALSGLVGLKPTYGVVSMTGILPNCWSLDHVGPLTRSVEDARIALSVMVGHDPKYAFSAPSRTLKELAARLDAHPTQVETKNVRLGLVDDPLFEIVDSRARAAFESLVAVLDRTGIDLVDVRIPLLRFASGTLLALNFGGATVLTDRLRAHPDGVRQADVRAALNIGHSVPGVLVERAAQVRRAIAASVARVFRLERLDALLVPANVAATLEKDDVDAVQPLSTGELEHVFWWSYPRPFYLANLTGQPSLVLPIVQTPPPLAAQLIGRPYRDDALLDVGALLESLLGSLPSGLQSDSESQDRSRQGSHG